MNKSEYHAKIATFDRDSRAAHQAQLDTLIDRIPQNVNRAGRHYQKLIKQIHAQNTRTK
jgi:hypothetical protein